MDERTGVSPGGELDPHDPPLVAQNLRSAANTVSYLTSENDRLESENSMLRQRIELMKKNSDLKTATVLSSIITWMDEKKKGKDGVNSRAGSPYRPSTPVLDDSAFKFLQSQSDGVLDGQDEPPRYNPPSVRFDTSRNTSMAPPEPELSASAFRDYTPHQSMPRTASGSQTIPKSSYGGNRSASMVSNDYLQNDMQPMRGSMSNGRYDFNSEQALRESLLGMPMTSTTKATSSRGILNNEPGPYRPDESSRTMNPDPEEVKRLAAKLARFSRPIDQVIGVRTEPRYYQGIMELKPTRRLVGEIAFQLDRRILDYVFSCDDCTSANSKARKKRYYGYTVTHIFDKIRAECKDAYGIPNLKGEMAMRYRLEFLMKRLAPLGYKLEIHAPFSQDMVNKFGLLSSPPERKTLDSFGLEDPRVLRMLVSKLMIFDDELKNTLILLDCLCLMAHEDNGPLFKW